MDPIEFAPVFVHFAGIPKLGQSSGQADLPGAGTILHHIQPTAVVTQHSWSTLSKVFSVSWYTMLQQI